MITYQDGLQLALDQLAQASKVLSSNSSEDVALMSIVVFTLFNQDIVKVCGASMAIRRVCNCALKTVEF